MEIPLTASRAVARPLPRRHVLADAHLPVIYPGFRRLPAPLIVIGMHRSGTSVVAAMLARLGVYMGAPLPDASEGARAFDPGRRSSGYGEAEAFFRVNELLLDRAGAAWNRVEPFLAARRQLLFERAGLAMLQAATFGPLRAGYLHRLSVASVQPEQPLWGWKDPRNSLTLPYWLRLFPEARVLHVRRSPEAAAESVWRRARQWREDPGAPGRVLLKDRLTATLLCPDRLARAAARRLRGARTAAPDPCLDRDYCLRLCNTYVQECSRYESLGARYEEIRYEDLLAAPESTARRLAAFAGRPADGETIRQAARLVAGAAAPT
ncbi:MAG TPA: sulfotransferase [Armatimonadota bacterium]|nr:sulfotransferase [Armatimonadota bacterium]